MKKLSRWVVACLAVLAFIAPLKFGTPVVTQARLIPPSGAAEWLFFSSWPNQIAVIFAFAGLVWVVLDSERYAARLDALFLLPIMLVATQALATTTSINQQLSADTLMHFATCALLYYAAAWYVRDGATAALVFGWLGLATFLVTLWALEQHFGGLQGTREFAALYGNQSAMPPDLRLRMTSNRVFAWFGGYPNALAGYLVVAFAPTLAWILAARRTLWSQCIVSGVACALALSAILVESLVSLFGLLVLAPIVISLWVQSPLVARRLRWFGAALASAMMIWALVLTESRGGFAAFAVMVLVGLLCCLPGGARRGMWVSLGVVILLAVFLVAQQAGYIRSGARSLEARGDYWLGATKIIREYPWLGSGPGTFGSIYPKYKTAQTEEAQLVHNNYLQMGSDSGLAAFIVFGALWLLALKDAFALVSQRRGDVGAVAVCAALAGWVVHGLLDFDLYVPGVAIPAFLLLGILQGLKEPTSVRAMVPQGNARWGVALVCVAVAGMVVWAELQSMSANLRYGAAQNRLSRSDLLGASLEIREAVALLPGNAYYQAVAGNLALRSGRFDEAIGYFQSAVRNDPFRASYHWGLAQAEIGAHGISQKAIEELRQAAALNPSQRCDDPVKPCYRQALADAEERVRQSSGGLLQSAPTRGE